MHVDFETKAESVYQHFQLSSPNLTQRSKGAHSGMTPNVDNTRQTVDDFLKLEGSSLAALPTPPALPGQETIDPTLQAILAGVNEIRATAVTQQTLREFYALQRAEYQTYVQAENAPLHEGMAQLNRSFAVLAKDAFETYDRLGKLESRVEAGHPSGASSSEPGPELHDPARRRVAFTNFPSNTTITERIEAMDTFMTTHFSDLKPLLTNLFPDKTGKPSCNGFVELVSPKQARHVTDATKSRGLAVAGYGAVEVKPALTDIDRNRIWALRTAEEKIRKSPKAHGKWVTVKKTDGRGVYVDGAPVFIQPQRYARDGIFQGQFADLTLR